MAAADTVSWRVIAGGREWRATPLDRAVTVRVAAPPPADPPDLATVIAAHWDAARRDRPALFNGRVFSVDRVTPGELVGHWTEYRRVLAQLRQPALFAALHLRPLAVNGLLECSDGLLLGRRDAGAVYQPGAWQAAPAGNVEHRDGADGIDLRDQVLAELDEELGVDGTAVHSVEPVLAIEHAQTRVIDIGLLLRTGLDAATVTKTARARGNAEYDAFRTVPRSEVATVVATLGASLLPTARALLDAWSRAKGPGGS